MFAWRKKAGGMLAGLAGIALAACVAQAQAPQAKTQGPTAAPARAEARPALWRLRDEDTTIYLFGTIHALPEGLEWQNMPIRRAMEDSNELVMELPFGEITAPSPAMMGMFVAQGLPPILQRVPADKRAALRAVIARSGVPMQAFDRMRTWAAAITLTVIGFQQLGIEGSRGVEQTLGTHFQERGRRTSGLETMAEQYGFFNLISEEAQRALLVSAADDTEEAREEFRRMLEAWRTGDVDVIAETFNEDAATSPQLNDVLLTQRNARWAEWLERRMQEPGRVFMAVGAGHLAGDQSVQTMLERRGVRVQRVQ